MKLLKYASNIIVGILLAWAYTPTFIWMWQRWFAPESYYGHGILIPLVSLYVVWRRSGLFKWSEASSEIWGLIIVVSGLALHIICAMLRVYFISGFSFVFVLYGLIIFLYGKQISGKLMFPVLFLLAMIPLPLVLIGNLTVQLKLLVAQGATFILNRIGFASAQDGNIIRMADSYITVGAPCSGLRSLISLLTLGVIFAFLMKTSFIKRSLLFLSSIPIAIASNVLRITLLAMVNDLYGEEVALGFFHNFSGFFVFGFAFMALFLVAKSLEAK